MNLAVFICLFCVLSGGSVCSRNLERLKRNAERDESTKWENAEVPYVIDSLLIPGMFKLFNQAIEDFNQYTCVRWRPKTENDTDWVLVRSDAPQTYEKDGATYLRPCSAHIGRTWYYGMHNLTHNLTLNEAACNSKGGVLHEMMHILGFKHEQSRMDRDEHVDLDPRLLTNHNFEKYDGETFNLTYDVYSVMHYQLDGAIEWKKNKSLYRLLSNSFSPTDIKKLNLRYNCSENSTPMCSSAGYIVAPGKESPVIGYDHDMDYWVNNGHMSILRITWVKKCVVSADKSLSLELGCNCNHQVYARNGVWAKCSNIWFKCPAEATLKTAGDWKPITTKNEPNETATIN